MTEKPTVKSGDWITFGSGFLSKSAVVCMVYQDTSLADIEVVYLDDQNRAINDDTVWQGDDWESKLPGSSGGCADKSHHHMGYVA